MVTFNSISLDLIIYGTRTVFHSRDFGELLRFSSIAVLTLLVVDYIEVWNLGS